MSLRSSPLEARSWIPGFEINSQSDFKPLFPVSGSANSDR
jgi:hypothetical protein